MISQENNILYYLTIWVIISVIKTIVIIVINLNTGLSLQVWLT